MAQPSSPPVAASDAAASDAAASDVAASDVAASDAPAESAAPTGTIVVQKYGGSSVADVPRIRAVARRVVQTVRDGHQVVVVVSAMGNTTNELLALARQVSAQPGRREQDLLVSVGERVSMTLLAMAIEDLGVPAASFTGSQSGIITDDQHVSAQVQEVRPHRIRRALAEGRVAIVAGFQGVSRGGEVTTLGRGGSDTTAVVLAAALGAQWCELASDVDGVFSADPRVVESAHRLDSLPLDAAAALAQGGSKIVAADAVAQARRWGVQLVASQTSRPSGSGTRLPPGPVPKAPVGVAADAQLLLLERVLPADLGSLAGSIVAWLPGPSGPRALVDSRNLNQALDPLLGARPVATVTAVGRCLVNDPAWTARVLAAAGSPTLWWATGSGLTVLVERAQADVVQRAVHDAVIGADSGVGG